ncbi:MAG: dihydroorotate dehydrogenase electron transfer subunit [Chloroflexia bacterium]|jgi:dihydroorotate dehydrogenase electron transfer subunit|nr:dihydroorotate dehydrogenase electron transfer subunit [Chloroflexia bacterium]
MTELASPTQHPTGWSREFIGEITATEPVMGDSVLVTFTSPPQLAASCRAGQFVELLCRTPQSSDPLLRRPFSVYATNPARQELTILVRPFGRGSAWLVEQPVGAILDVLGPLGNTFTVAPKSKNLLMVAGGVGAAPLLMLANEAVAKGMNVTYLLGAMNAGGLLAPGHLPGEVEYIVATIDGSAGRQGFVTDLVSEYVQWADQVFACGPEPMFRSLRREVLANRFAAKPTVQMSVERTMACGVGACLGCMVETRRGMRTSCVEGPVFEMDELAW